MNSSSNFQSGKIIKLTGGLYTVESLEGTYECRARGIFRKKGISPVVGDNVEFSEGMIEKIQERKNILLRPPVANLDRIFFVVSTTEPVPNYYVLDQLIAVAESQSIEPVIVVTKSDIDKNDELKKIYSKAGLKVIETDYSDSKTVDKVKELIKGKCCAFTGNSGVGKSTLMNAIDPELNIPTNAISKKLGRGKHTTRHTELYHICGGLVADTPGFSAFDTAEYCQIEKEELSHCFREFRNHMGKCRFNNCTHTCEPGCKVIEAVKNGEISEKRHENYCIMYNEIKQRKEW